VPDVPDDDWAVLRDELAGDVRRVADRLRDLSEARLAGPPTSAQHGMPPYVSRAQAGRAAAQTMADSAGALEAAAAGTGFDRRELPELADFAVGDQVAVTGNDLLSALDLVGPDDEVWFGELDPVPAKVGVARVARLLADVRQRL
jgi:hypothetical protein